MRNLTGFSFISIIMLVYVPLILTARSPIQSSIKDQRLLFIENKGQITDQYHSPRTDIQFKCGSNDMSVFIGAGAIHYQWYKQNAQNETTTPGNRNNTVSGNSTETYRIDAELLNANKNAQASASDKQDYFEHYYNEQFAGGATAHSYGTVTYKNIYPNIDWRIYVKNGSLKYEFIVHKGGNYRDIQIRYAGNTSLTLSNGAPVIAGPMGSITEHAPYTYYAASGTAIQSSFIQKDNTLSFNLNVTSATEGDIVIDPSLAWSTYYGSNQDEYGQSVVADELGNSYLAGQTKSASNIATVGSYQATIGGDVDGYIVKFSVNGLRQWATYYGGLYIDYFRSLAFEKTGFIYATGVTNSANGIATPGSHQDTYAGLQDAFLVKFDLNGQRQWATYYGGNAEEIGYDVVCDQKGGVYIGGRSYSDADIASPGAYRTARNNNNNGFLAKFDGAGTWQWGTYNQSEEIYSITCDTFGHIYFTGTAGVDTGIASPGCFQPSKNSTFDGYLQKFNPDGTKAWGTYFGGLGSEDMYCVACDMAGNIYIGGGTTSTTDIATVGSYKTSFQGDWDAFIVKFDATGARKWGTYLGGPAYEELQAICVAPKGEIYVAGTTTSTSGIATFNSHQTIFGGGPHDVFLMTLNSQGFMQYGTYMGGAANDLINDMYLNSAIGLYVPGTTQSTGNIAEPSTVYQYTHGGGNDAFLALFVTDTLYYINQPFTDTLFCQGDSLKIKFSITPNMPAGNVFTAWLSDSLGNFANQVAIGSFTSQVSGAVPCKIPANIPPGKGYRVRISSSVVSHPTNDNGVNIRIKETPVKPVLTCTPPFCEPGKMQLTSSTPTTTAGVTYSWTSSNGMFTSNAHNPSIDSATANYTGLYKLALELDGCKSEDTISVRIKSMPAKPQIIHNAPVCEDDTLTFKILGDTVDVLYTWAWPNPNVVPGLNNVVDKATLEFNGEYIVLANKDGCKQSDTAYIVVKPRPHITASSNSPAFTEQELLLYARGDTNASATYSWTGPNNFTSADRDPVLNNISDKAAGTYTVTASIDGCSSSAITIVVVRPSSSDTYFYVSPNPNNGNFTLMGNVSKAQDIKLDVVDATGKRVYTESFTTTRKMINHSISLPAELANGIYFIRVHADNKNSAVRFISEY